MHGYNRSAPAPRRDDDQRRPTSMPIAFRPRLPRRTRARRAGRGRAGSGAHPAAHRAALARRHRVDPHRGAVGRSSAPGWPSTSTSTPLDLEDVMSRNQRPKIDEYPDYLFIVLHFPIFDKQVGRLNAGELDLFVGPDFIITLPNQPLKPVEYLFERCRTNEEIREQLFSKGTGLPALPDRRPVVRLLLPDAAQDREQARAAGGGDLRRPRRGDRARHLQREAGDHQLPQDHPARSAPCCATSSARSSATCARSWRSTSTTSWTPPSGSGTCSRTTRRSWRRSRTRTSP